MRGRSFWSSIPGVVTGTAGLLTAIVGLVTLLIQLGVIGGHDKKPSSTRLSAGSSVESSTTSGAGGYSGDTSNTGLARPMFSVQPTSLTLKGLGQTQGTVKVSNDGTAPLTVSPVRIQGTDPQDFTADDTDCTGSELPPNQTCQIKITYKPKSLGSSSATLVVNTAGAASAKTVALSGTPV